MICSPPPKKSKVLPKEVYSGWGRQPNFRRVGEAASGLQGLVSRSKAQVERFSRPTNLC